MTPEERQLVTGLFERLRQNDHRDRDPEAQELIEAGLVAHPDAPYLMTQLLLLQARALSAAQDKVRALQRDVSYAPGATRSPASEHSFLAGVPQRGPWDVASNSSAAPVSSAKEPRRPVSSSGGSFLRGAVQTAAGVAGGALLFEGINSLLHMGSSGWGHGLMPGSFLGGGAPTLVEETVINDYGDRQPPLDPAVKAVAGDDAQPFAGDASVDATDWTDNASDPGDSDIDNV